MANWSNPSLTSTYTNFLSDLKARDEDLAKQFDGQTTSNLPSGAVRWSSSLNRWQKWTGSAWDELAATYALTGLSTTGNAAIGGTLTVTGVSQLAAGTAAAPGLGIGEATSGWYRVSAGVLGLATGGVEALRVDSQGRIGSKATSLGSANGAYRFAAAPTGNASSNGLVYAPSIATDVTGTCNAFMAQPSTTDGITGLSNLRHFAAVEGTITGGTRGAVAIQIGYLASSTLVSANNNYGFYGDIPASAGDYNFYAGGTAPNYYAGDVRTNVTFTSRTVAVDSGTNGAVASTTSLLNGIRTSTPTADITLLVPTGTDMDAAFNTLESNQGFEWSLINLATAVSGFDVTVTANTAHTVVGNMRVTGETSGRFKTRKISANTFTTYRIA
ncbi:MAG: hypothetical protein EBS91_03470 [Betaproteobacteria bacterium]|nr:hypothetical protein [Betaproteobacteria bacterium]NCA23677.1 hypothetical protein [Betaproteobacteria bacterium]